MFNKHTRSTLRAGLLFGLASLLAFPAFANGNHGSASVGGQLSGGVSVSQGGSSASVSSSGNGSASVTSTVTTTGEAAAGGSLFHNGVDEQSGYQSTTTAGITTSKSGHGSASGSAGGSSTGLSGSAGAVGTLSGWNL
jgi:hypothetical protein